MSNSNTSNGSSDPNAKDGGETIAIVAIITMGVVSLIVVVAIYMCVKLVVARRQRPSTSTGNESVAPIVAPSSITNAGSFEIQMDSMNRFLDDILKQRAIRFNPQHLKQFTRNYAEMIGSGGFGVVYKGKLPNGEQVAVKVLKNTLDKKTEEQFMAEVGTIGRTYHVNLVRLYGFCFEQTVKALVYKYMENGSLEQHLFVKDKKIEFDKLYEIAVGTAKGIRYLHEECEQRIVHYDIKPGNVLLTANFTPKVADFGLAKLCDREVSHLTITGARGTPGYTAPELWMPLPVTPKCDVYSFGMLLFEIIGRRRNLALDMESQEWYPKWVWKMFEEGKFEQILTHSGIKEEQREKAERMVKVALRCVQYLPEARPSMNSVVRMLEGEEEIVTPTDPFAHMASNYVVCAANLFSDSTSVSTSAGTTTKSSAN